ncbi:MAG TPA: NAD(P)/FAD-dependent oxidoreductase [Chitinophagaceae bacterium]|nr:NAD(P)/FAD-dependent oxidoreductase [Chitinophagaceae bacterium]
MGVKQFEIAIIGGSAAGLSAALVLGRSRREVIVIDDGNPRNAQARYSHGVYTNDGLSPQELGHIGREQLKPYPVELCTGRVISIRKVADGFTLQLRTGELIHATKILLATGIQDQLPDIPGLREQWGKTIFSCPYCDGWELNDKHLVVVGSGKKGFEFTQLIRQWSKNVTLCTNDGPAPENNHVDYLQGQGIPVIGKKIIEIMAGSDNVLTIHFEDGRICECQGIFLEPACSLRSELVEQLGCRMDDTGKRLQVDGKGRTTVEGVYAAGDISALHSQITIAAASGVEAAFTINHDLVEEAMVPVDDQS